MLKPWLLNETAADAGGDGGTGDGADTGRPDFLLDKFKTPEEQARAYAEAEKEMQRLRSDRDADREQFAQALSQIEAATPQPQPDTGLDPQINQMLTDYQRAVESGDAAAQLAIQLGLNQQIINQALEERFNALDPKLKEQSQADRDIAFEIASERVAKSYGDQWTEVQPDVQKWLREHQSWLPTENRPEAFEQVIREAAMTVVNAKAAERLAGMEADRAAKVAAATGDGSGQGRHPTVTDEKKAAWDEVKGADVGSYSGLRRS